MKRRMAMAAGGVTWVAMACLPVLLAATAARAQQPSLLFEPVQADTLAETLTELTRTSGNGGVGDLLSALTAIEVATAPLGSPSAGFIVAYDDRIGFPRRRSTTFGPQFIERALTSGRGTASFGVNLLTATYDSISGRPLNDLRLATFHGTDPTITSSTLRLALRSRMTALFGGFGLTDTLDLAVTLPLVQVDIDARQELMEGDIGSAVVEAAGSAFGLGDLVMQAKYQIWRSADTDDGLSGVVRLRAPTGDADDLRGIDVWRTFVGAAASATLGRAAFHVNGGYEFWDRNVDLTNTLPDNLGETWSLADTVQYGAAVEFELHPTLTLVIEATGRHLRSTGRLEVRRLDARSDPDLGVTGVDVLMAGPGSLRTISIVPGLRWNIRQSGLLSVGLRMNRDNTGLRDQLTPMVGLNWTLTPPTR